MKRIALALLAAASFLGPFLEVLVRGEVEPFGAFELGETIVALVLIFWWYHLDKAERGYRAGPLMNGGMLAVTALAMPVYLFRTRGWKDGATATAIAAAVFGLLYGLGEAGAWLAGAVRPVL